MDPQTQVTQSGTSDRQEALRQRFRQVRDVTQTLCAPLSPEDAALQSMPDASPAKWHMAHTSWFFETFLLERELRSYRPFNASYRVLFNSYYHSVGEQYARPQRGLLSRPSLGEVVDYRAHVNQQMDALLSNGTLPGRTLDVVELGLHHEQQHQELLLTDLKHLFSHNPLHPVYRETTRPPPCRATGLDWQRFEGGPCEIGHSGAAFAFDNEGPRHRVYLEPFALAARPVTNHEYLEFVKSGGYEEPEHWLADGWAAVRERNWKAPLYWRRADDGWSLITLSGLRGLRPEAPVCHVSYYEADAYARWAGARLPRETEWEHATQGVPVEGNFLEDGLLHPAAAPSGGSALSQLFGDVWEWTQSPYAPYPGFRPPAGALGEYNGKFMCNQFTLRGGSCVTPRSHIRATYRNFFYPDARWQFSGIRLARDL